MHFISERSSKRPLHNVFDFAFHLFSSNNFLHPCKSFHFLFCKLLELRSCEFFSPEGIFFFCFSFYTCTKLSVLWSRVLFMALFCKMELIGKRTNYILRFEWLNVRSERAIIPVWCRDFIHKAHFTVLLGPVRCHYLSKWNMYNGKQDNDWQKNVHLSQSSAWMCRILCF